jgi:TRAP-type C4-dicarboxylate transport system substrate-binding protein
VERRGVGIIEQEYVARVDPPGESPDDRLARLGRARQVVCRTVSSRSNIYPSMQLGGRPPQLIDQFRDGVVDMGWTLPGYTAGRFPRVEVFELPFVHKTTYATNMALVDFQDLHLRDEFKDYKILLLHVHAGSVVITRDKPIRRLEDFEGLKIRTPNEPGSWLLESVGATPVGTPITEVTQLLSRGVIDGALVPFEIVWPFKMHEMTKYHIDIPGRDRMVTSLFFFGMNKKRYEQLPADLRKVIDDTTGRALAPIAAEVELSPWHSRVNQWIPMNDRPAFKN